MSEEKINATDIKNHISFPQLMNYYGYKIERSKILCPFHQENTASFHIYEDGGHCYGGCGWHGDVIQFVMDREACYFLKAVELLSSWFGITKDTPKQKPTKAKTVPKVVRREPVNPSIVNFYSSCLSQRPDKRGWLRNERLLTDETIDYLKIGYRPDMDAYSIPFWKGAPGISEVDIMQFRYCPKEGRKSRYISLDNHGFAGLVGRHTLNSEFLVFFVGTLDCILANQDGIPAVSPNGLNVWKRRMDELKWILGKVERIYFVPDNSASETIESARLANELGAKLKYLPEMPDYDNGKQRKDYTDYRLLGHTPKQFLREVLGVSDTPFITDDRHTQTVRDILEMMIIGDLEKSLELLEIIRENSYKWYSVSNKLMLLASMHPEGASDKDWECFVRKLELAHSYEAIAQVIKETAFDMQCKRGEF